MLSIDLIQQIIYSLALAILLVALSRVPRISLFLSALLFLLILLGENLLPLWRGSSLVELARGVVGDLSTASGGLLFLIILNQFDFSETKSPVLNQLEKIALLLMGLLLYLATFGFISYDIYHLGYLSKWMLFSLTIAALVMILCERRLGYVCLVVLAGFYFHLQASHNLWDYLLDPVLWLVLVVDGVYHLLPAKPVIITNYQN